MDTDVDQDDRMAERIEREQVEWVFHLTGGELADTPWRYWYKPDYQDKWEPTTTQWWYEQAPEYAMRELDGYDCDVTLRTMVAFGGGLLPAPDTCIVDEQGMWELVATYTNSGETECPGQHEDTDLVTTEHTGGRTHRVNQFDQTPQSAECVLCEEPLGHPHGYIYIGDGYEAVYRLTVPWPSDDE
jgi:hypothetical protein